MGYQTESSNDLGIGTSVNYGNNAIGVDNNGGGFGTGSSGKKDQPGGFGFPLFRLPKSEEGEEENVEPNTADAYANDYATNTNNAGQQNLNESQKAIRGWISPIPGSIGTQEGALARTRGAGTPAPTPTSRAYVNNARNYSSINNMNALGRQAQEANNNAYGQGTRDYSSLPPTLSSQFANWGARSDAQEKHNAINGYMENLGGHAEHPTHSWAENAVTSAWNWLGNRAKESLTVDKAIAGYTLKSLENLPHNLDNAAHKLLGNPQGAKSGFNTAVTGGAGASVATSNTPLVIP